MLAGWCLTALLATSAQAKSQLIITSDRPVVVVVNLKPYPLQGGPQKLVIDFPDGKEGRQRMMVRSLIGQSLWTGEIDVPVDKRVEGRWAGNMTFNPPRDLERRKLSDKGLVIVDGKWVYQSEAPRIGPADEQEAILEPVDPTEAYADAVAAAAGEEGVGGVVQVEVPPDRPAPGSPGVLALQNRTTSWANLVVDGKDVEFRGERRKELPIGSGPHQVEVRDFNHKLRFAGTVWVGPEATVELQFSETAEPAVPGSPDAWESRPTDPEP